LKQFLRDAATADSFFNLPLPGFQLLLDICHELVGECAVNQSVIERERQHDDRANRDGVVDYLPPRF
jgi:hypothetical protein